MYKLNSNGEQGAFGSINRLRQGHAYICEIANGKFLAFFLSFRLFVCLFVCFFNWKVPQALQRNNNILC